MGTWLEHVKVMMFPPERRRTRIKHFHDPRDESTVLVQFYRNCRVKEEDKARENQNFILLITPAPATEFRGKFFNDQFMFKS